MLLCSEGIINTPGMNSFYVYTMFVLAKPPKEDFYDALDCKIKEFIPFAVLSYVQDPMEAQTLSLFPTASEFLFHSYNDYTGDIIKIAQQNRYQIVYLENHETFPSRIKVHPAVRLDNSWLSKFCIINAAQYIGNNIFVDENQDFLVIGDVHEQLDLLKELLGIYCIFENDLIVGYRKHRIKFILIGDIIDKGCSCKQVLEFVKKNISFFILILGNHERAVKRHLLKEMIIPSDKLVHYSSLKVLEFDAEACALFFELYALMKDFIIIRYPNDFKIIASHAPCERHYLGKMDSKSLSAQVYYYLERGSAEANAKNIQNIMKMSFSSHPCHIFGHVSFSRLFQNKSMLGIDTGACYNQLLTGILASSITSASVMVNQVGPNSGSPFNLHVIE